MDIMQHIEDTLMSISSQDVDGLNKEFTYQTDNFSSKDYNSTMLAIEARLNLFYEHARGLEDSIEYAKEFIKENIYSIKKECSDILNSIEENIDSIRDGGYTIINVPLQESNGSYVDRDKKTLLRHSIYDGVIALSSKNETSREIYKISTINNFIPYRQNIENIKDKKAYRSFYMLDNPVNGGLKEQIKIDLKSESESNQLTVITSNCKVNDVVYESENGTKIFTNGGGSAIQKMRPIKSITITTETSSYKKMTYYVDESRIASNFWDTIASNELNIMTSKNGMDQAKIDEITGLAAFRKEYQDYIKAVNKWIEDRKAVANVNMANGYADTVPVIDFIIPPASISRGDLNSSKDKESQEATKYSYSTIVQKVVPKTPQVFPDTEKIYYQSSELNMEMLNKDGSVIDYFTDSFQQSENIYNSPEIR